MNFFEKYKNFGWTIAETVAFVFILSWIAMGIENQIALNIGCKWVVAQMFPHTFNMTVVVCT